MKITAFAQTLHDLGLLKEKGVEEVILGHQDLSRFGKLTTEALLAMANRAKELGLKVIIEWDVLMTEEQFGQKVLHLREILSAGDALRVQDPGALNWALAHTELPLQFIAETGNHNLKALQGWCDYAGKRLERIILSIELPKQSIAEYVQKLPVACELLGLGRILLFYTPRSLLGPLMSERHSQNVELAALGESEESPHKGFPILENRHGTFMFHIKEFCLLDQLSGLRELGLSFLRLDLRWQIDQLAAALDVVQQQLSFEDFKQHYPQDLMRGFYLVNKTDVLFPKLKNHRLQKREGNYLGEVLEAEKGSHLAILIKHARGVQRSDRLEIVHPKGGTFDVGIYSLKNSALEEVGAVPQGQLAIIQFVNGVWPKSQVFFAP
jgi:U32 family peptidase